MKKNELREMAESIAANGYNNMVDETGDFEVNMRAVTEGVRIWQELDDTVDEEDVRKKKLQNDILNKELEEKEIRQLEHSLDRDLELEQRRIEIEKLKLDYEIRQDEIKDKKKNEKWERGLKIASIAAPVVATTITTVVGAVIFKKKVDQVNYTLKLNTVLQEKGMISGINNNRVVEQAFSELLKK